MLSVSTKLIAQKTPIAIGMLAPILSGGMIYLHDEIAPLLSDTTGWLALKTTALSITVLLLSIAFYLWHRPNFKHLPLLDVHENIKTGTYFCSRCLLKEKLQSPLATVSHGWKCPACSKWSEDPDNPSVNLPTVHHWK